MKNIIGIVKYPGIQGLCKNLSAEAIAIK